MSEHTIKSINGPSKLKLAEFVHMMQRSILHQINPELGKSQASIKAWAHKHFCTLFFQLKWKVFPVSIIFNEQGMGPLLVVD